MPEKTAKRKLITLLGPPNSGKTTLFNLLTGKKYKTVNYPGATTEYSISKFTDDHGIDCDLMDSPGIISLVPASPDEKITIDNLYEHPEYGRPDVVIVTIDASQFSRHFLLAKQLLDSGFSVIIAITMNDILGEKGHYIESEELSRILNTSVIKIDPRKKFDVGILIKKVNEFLDSDSEHYYKHVNYDEKKLLDLFEEIGRIEINVIKSRIESANKQLGSLNTSLSGYLPDKMTIQIDKIMLHKIWGIFIFLLAMGAIFSAIFWLAAPLMEGVDHLFSHMSDYVSSNLEQGWLSDLLSNGIIGGLGAVMVFLPQIVILFIILGFLEDSGYLARGAMLIDLPLSKIGLNGRSFVPMLSGFACAIPAVMAARTIQNKRERYLTIFIIPLMSCSARLPVYGLLLAFLLPGQFILSGFVLSLIYLLGVITSLIVAGVLNKYKSSILKIEDNSSFIMELPVYRIPRFSNIFKHTYENAWEYVRKAGPIILVFSVILWFLTYFPEPDTQRYQDNTHQDSVSVKYSENKNWQISLNEMNPEYDRISHSYAAKIGKFIEPVMLPLGLDWRVGVSLITTFAAREVFVSSLALIFKIPETENENIRESLLISMKDARISSTGAQIFTTSTIIGLIFFFVLAMQCISTLAITKKETGSWKLPLIQVIVYTGAAYVVMFLVVNSLRFFGVS